MKRPDWKGVYRNVAHYYDRDDELVQVTRETARLSASAIRTLMEQEAHHNFLVAEYELEDVLSD